MNFWYEFPCDFVTTEYGRYEAVCDQGPDVWPYLRFTWTPVLAGPQPSATDEFEENCRAVCGDPEWSLI